MERRQRGLAVLYRRGEAYAQEVLVSYAMQKQRGYITYTILNRPVEPSRLSTTT